jgi:hypothetical protein
VPRRLAIPLGGVLLLGLFWCGAWWIATGMLIDQINGWVAANNGPDVAVAHGPIARDGFPLEIAARIPTVGISSAGYSATTAALRLAIQPWKPDRIAFQTDDAVEFAATLGPALRIERVVGSMDRTADLRDRLTLDLLAPKGSLQGGRGDLTAARIRTVISRSLSDPTPVIVAIDAQGLASSVAPETIDLKLEALWRGPTDLGDPPNLSGWRDAGGAFELREVVLTNGAARLSGGAVITLDSALRPAPNGSVTLRGVKPFMDRLTALGVTSPRDAAIGQTALTLLAKPGADGQPEVTMPISSRDGWLMVGPLRVTRLPPLPGR